MRNLKLSVIKNYCKYFFDENWLVIIVSLVIMGVFIVSYNFYYEYIARFDYLIPPERIFGQGNESCDPGDILCYKNVERDAWGQTGDFFGGLLNPLISFAALIIFYINLIITKKEFNNMGILVDKQLKAQEKQGFENNFFILLNQHNQLVSEVKKLDYHFSWETVIKPEDARTKLREDMDEQYDLLKKYFRFLYQVLDFIFRNHPSSVNNEGDKICNILQDKKVETDAMKKDVKFYSKLIRASIGNELCELVLINSICLDKGDKWGFHDFKCLIEYFELLEHVQIDEKEDELKSARSFFSGSSLIRAYDTSGFEEVANKSIINRVDFYREITREDRGEKYYKKSAYGDHHFYDRVHWQRNI